MRRTVLSVPLCLLLLSGVNGAPAAPFHHPAIEARYTGGGGDGNAVLNSNDAEMGQLNGIFNALINELQTAPKLANGPQAEAQRQADQAHRDEITPDNMDQTTPNPAVTDAPPADAPPEPKMIRPVTNNQNRFGENVNFNNFQQPPQQFNGPQFNGPYNGGPYNGPFNGGPSSMYTPPGPSPYALPFQGGPGGPGPYGQGPYGGYDNGPYGNQDYPPQQPRQPIGNPGSYGADNSALQESGMGQLGQFFSSMVSELQNSGFNNNVESAIAPKKPVKARPVPVTVRATTATTTTTQKTKTTTEEDGTDS